MQITKREFDLLAKLSRQIKEAMKIKIGFSFMCGCFIDDADEFIAYEIDPAHYALYSVHDIDMETVGFLRSLIPSSNPLHDEECRSLLENVRKALKENIIEIPAVLVESFDLDGGCLKVSISRELGNYSVKVTKNLVTTGFLLRPGEKARHYDEYVRKVIDIYEQEYPSKETETYKGE